MRTTDPNLVLLAQAVTHLGPLVDRMVFLGGCATALLLTDPAAPEVRPTQDVDVITDIASLTDYYRLAEGLREAGFVEDQSPGAPLCRWRASEVILDIMPTDENVFGFGNRWYRPALANAQLIDLPTGQRIRAVTAPYFLATKLEAFAGRGGDDYLASPDLEDIVTLVDGRAELVGEVTQADADLRQFLSTRLSTLLATPSFLEALSAHLPPDAASQARVPILRDRIRLMARAHP
jgi:hypothetical protein